MCVGGCASRQRRKGKCDSVSYEQRYFFFFFISLCVSLKAHIIAIVSSEKNEEYVSERERERKKEFFATPFP